MREIAVARKLPNELAVVIFGGVIAPIEFFKILADIGYAAGADMPRYRAIRYGNVVGTITISRAGASTSIPSEEEIAAFMKEHAIEI